LRSESAIAKTLTPNGSAFRFQPLGGVWIWFKRVDAQLRIHRTKPDDTDCKDADVCTDIQKRIAILQNACEMYQDR
jgi:hypothetical protein